MKKSSLHPQSMPRYMGYVMVCITYQSYYKLYSSDLLMTYRSPTITNQTKQRFKVLVCFEHQTRRMHPEQQSKKKRIYTPWDQDRKKPKAHRPAPCPRRKHGGGRLRKPLLNRVLLLEWGVEPSSSFDLRRAASNLPSVRLAQTLGCCAHWREAVDSVS